MSKAGPASSRSHPRLGAAFVLLSGLSFLAFVYNLNRPQPATSTAHPASPLPSPSMYTMSGRVKQQVIADFCPHSTLEQHIPTVILRGDNARADKEDRTYFVAEYSGRFAAQLAPRTRDRLLFDQQIEELPYGADAVRGAQLCGAYEVPSTAPRALPGGWSNSKMMFGMSTKPERVMFNLPVWLHWMPHSPTPLDGTPAATRDLPLLVVLTPPAEGHKNQSLIRQSQEDGLARGVHIEVRPRVSSRFETRYFALAQEMWRSAQKREREEPGLRVEWFVFADDDTFFPDWTEVVHMLDKYDPDSPLLIGGMSEAIGSLAACGVIAYGGAGIFVSRAMLAAINAPGVWEDCLDEFEDLFGGDNMVSRCAALATGQDYADLRETLVVEAGLHQLDIMRDGSGWFQSGFLVTSMHHWATWFDQFPDWHALLISSTDVRDSIALAGRAAKAVGGANWLRRFAFDNGRAIVTLGYSVVVYARPLSYFELGQSEHTWQEFPSFWPMREAITEAFDKKSYYLTSVRALAPGVTKLEHKNREGERFDVVWDARRKPATLASRVRDRARW